MQKFIVGLTGPTGAGKSTARYIAEDIGFFCIDADKVARDATKIGSPLLPILKKEFGDVLNPDGSLNRKALAAAAFKDKDKTEQLNSIMLPHILKMIENIIKKAESRLILLDAPTLFEAGADSICNKTVGVIADKKVRLERIMERDNLTKDAALLRIEAGKDDGFYKNKCDYLLTNNKSEAEFTKEVKKLFLELTLEAV